MLSLIVITEASHPTFVFQTLDQHSQPEVFLSPRGQLAMSGTFLVVTTGVYGGHINHVFLCSVFHDALTSWGPC